MFIRHIPIRDDSTFFVPTPVGSNKGSLTQPISHLHDLLEATADDNELSRDKVNAVVEHDDIKLWDIVMRMLLLLAFILW